MPGPMNPPLPPRFFALTLPSASLAVVGTFWGSPVAVPGILKIIQCRTSSFLRPIATSGSCKIKAKVTVPGGTCVQSSLGETGFASDCVNLFGMTPPSSKSGEVSVSPGPGGGPPGFPCAKAEPRLAAKNIAATASFLMSVSPWNVSAYQEAGSDWGGRSLHEITLRRRPQHHRPADPFGAHQTRHEWC